MPYHYVEFDNVALPLGNPRQDQSPSGGESGLYDSIGSAINYFGEEQRLARRHTIPVEGLYWGEQSYFSDDGTGYESGDALIWADEATHVRAQTDGLREKVGRWGVLWRKRLDDDTLQWKNARMVNLSHPQEVRDRKVIARLNCTFESNEPGWKAADITTRTKALSSDGFAYAYVLEVDGTLPIADASLTFTRGAGTITAISIVCAALGIDLQLSGLSLSSGSITIDCSNNTIRLSTGADAYSHLAFGAGHSSKGWLPLTPGNHLFYLTVTGGTAIATFSYYSQYP